LLRMQSHDYIVFPFFPSDLEVEALGYIAISMFQIYLFPVRVVFRISCIKKVEVMKWFGRGVLTLWEIAS
jgi:hypothetical protein